MNRNIIAVFMSLCVIVQGICISFAQGESIQGWSITNYGEGNNDEAKFSAAVTTEYKYDGEQSMMVKYQIATKDESKYIEIKNSLTDNMPSGEYTLSFYSKGSAAPDHTVVSIGEQKKFTYSEMEAPISVEAPSEETGWKKYSVVFDYTEQEQSFLAFRFYARIMTEEIDNVSLIFNETGEDYIYDGGFEDYLEEEDDEPEEIYDLKEYQPTNFNVYKLSNGLVLGWKNPSTKELSEIKIYDVTDGSDSLTTNEISTTPGGIVLYKIPDLEIEKLYRYKIVFSFTDKPDVVYIAEDSTASVTQTGGAWSLLTRTGNAGYCPANIYVDETVSRSGKASLKLESNIDRNVPELLSNVYVNARQTLPLNVGSKYRFKFYVKGENVSQAPQIHMNWVGFDGRGTTDGTLIGTYDWKEVSYTYTCKDQFMLIILMDGLCDGLWFDDMSFYEINDNGEEIGENLLLDGDFEDIYQTQADKITELSGVGEVGAVSLTWKACTGDVQKYNIYQKIFDKYEYRGYVINNSARISSLVNGEEYTFMIKPVYNVTQEGIGEEVTVTTVLPEYEIHPTVLYKEDNVTNAISGTGSYKILTPIKNNLIDGNMEVEQFVAIYKGKELIGISSTAKKIKKTKNTAKPTNVVTEFQIPEDGCHVEIFIVNSRTQWRRWRNSITYNSEVQ